MEQTEVIPMQLADGQVIYVQATISGEEDVAFEMLPFATVTSAIEGISSAVIETIKKVKPKKACVEFGIDIAIESGKLTALIVKGSGTASLKISLEWGE